MTVLSYPNHPVGSDIKSIENILANFDSVVSWANGNIDTNNLSPTAGVKDSQIASPNNAVRRTLLQGHAYIGGGQPSSEYFFAANGAILGAGAFNAGLPMWPGDFAGEFAVPGKAAKARIRVAAITNVVAPGVNFNCGLTTITSVAGTTGNLAITSVSNIASSEAVLAAPIGGGAFVFESPEFVLPAASVQIFYIINSGTTAASSGTEFCMQLVAYNV